MTLIPQFLSSLQRLKPLVDEGPLSTMTRAALSAADTFPGVDGAVICASVDTEIRVAAGVSDGVALLVEQLEFTLGDGPGLKAQRAGRQVLAGAGGERRWPVFDDAVSSATGVRVVRAVPLTGGGAGPSPGVLMLLHRSIEDADRMSHADGLDIAQLALLIGHALVLSRPEVEGFLDSGGRSWSGPPDIGRRLAVRTAVGMVAAGCGLARNDAWAVVRSYAFVHSRLIDDVAHDLVRGRLAAAAFA